MATQEETKLHLFLQWLQVNGVELRGCQIKYCDSNKGFGLFSTSTASDEVLLVVPLNLAITPMRVLDDPLMGPICRAMLKEGEVDDRFLIILFLIVERLRSKSSWKPYLDMIPHSFGTPLWFTDSEFHELKGTTIYQATILQKKSLHAVFEDKVKDLVKQLLILDGESESEVAFEDFLWANSVFWTRALNIPLPRTFVFPEGQQGSSDHLSNLSYDSKTSCNPSSFQEVAKKADKSDTECEKPNISSVVNGVLNFVEAETLWVEGLVPGIDFCNHALKAAATWEVDSTGSAIGVPFSMYLQSVNQGPPGIEKEITISYGNKGNEELLYLYGFVIEDNPDDFLMVHYPAEAVQSVPFLDSKTQLLQAQNAELRCLLPKRLLDRGFFPSLSNGSKSIEERPSNKIPNYSWSGQRTIPSYVDKLVFPEEFLTSLRTIAMQENELFKVQSLLEELVGTEGERELSDGEVRAAVWEACGDAGAFQLLVDMLNSKLIDLEEGSGTEESDSELLNKTCVQDSTALPISADKEDFSVGEAISKNRWVSIVYRRGQKQLARLFLREAEQALQLCLAEEC